MSEFIGGLIFFRDGVPVNATKAAFGSASFIRTWFSPPWLRCPSSIRTMISGLVLTHSGSFVAELNFWIRVKMMRSLPEPICFASVCRMSPLHWLCLFPGQLAAGCKGTAELFFKIDTVRHHHDTTPLQAVMKNQRLAEEHHGVRFARAGGMPDNTTFLPPSGLRVLMRSSSLLIPNTC